ncbi:glycogen/starch/alpha-glucan phosphorylase [Shigella flexneri]
MVQNTQARMANMCVVSGFAVNGVGRCTRTWRCRIRSRRITSCGLPVPQRHQRTTPRCWIKQCNPALAALLDKIAEERVGERFRFSYFN